MNGMFVSIEIAKVFIDRLGQFLLGTVTLQKGCTFDALIECKDVVTLCISVSEMHKSLKTCISKSLHSEENFPHLRRKRLGNTYRIGRLEHIVLNVCIYVIQPKLTIASLAWIQTQNNTTNIDMDGCYSLVPQGRDYLSQV